eukprot:scaffold21998_cov147-Skeletonema_menzelii.AAC.2
MVKFSQAASVLLLALGTTAFVPSKLGSVGVRSSVNSGAVLKTESCDAKVGALHVFKFLWLWHMLPASWKHPIMQADGTLSV